MTTKLFCGKCGAAMVGYSGVSHTSKQYCYYSCVNQKKRKCKKKPIRKDLIEPIVVQEVKNTLQSKYLKSIAKKIAALSRENGNDDMIKYLEKKLKENATALENLVTALEQGKSVDISTSQIEKRQVERDGLEVELAKERIKSPELSEDEILFFFERFKKGDIHDQAYCSALVDIFISKILLLKIKMVII